MALRIAITLGKNGGVMHPYTALVKYGLGGRQGNGKQMFSWIHIEDLFGIIHFVMSNGNIEGIYNAAAPNPVTNKVLMQTMRGVLRPMVYLSSPKFLLKAGAYVINTETELILKSRWVIPSKLTAAGFVFQYPQLEGAVKNLLV